MMKVVVKDAYGSRHTFHRVTDWSLEGRSPDSGSQMRPTGTLVVEQEEGAKHYFLQPVYFEVTQ